MHRIARVEAIPVSYPEPNDFDALRHLCLVKITTDDGVVGWGESITQFPEANFAIKAIIEGMAERLVGRDPLDNIAIWHCLRDQSGGTATTAASPRYAVAAIDIALWDIKGKLLGIPVVHLLGGAVHEKLPAVASCHAHYEDIGRMVEEAQEWVAPGLHGVKVGFGKRGDARLGYEHDRDVEYMRRMREGLGPEQLIMIDCGWRRQVGRHDRRPSRPGLRGVRPALDRGAARRLGPGGLRQPAQQDDLAHRLRREGVGPRRLRARSSPPAPSTSWASIPGAPRASPASRRPPSGSSSTGARRTPTPGRSAIVPAASLAISFSRRRRQAVRVQAAAQPDAARPGGRAVRARRRLGLPADQAGPGHRDHRGGRRPLPAARRSWPTRPRWERGTRRRVRG